MQLSQHFTLNELTRSQTATRLGIDNAPDVHLVKNLKKLCCNILQPLRNHIGTVVVTSGYRSPKLNAQIGGAIHSRHIQGLAADIIAPGISTRAICQEIIRLNLPFDQLIEEGHWSHVSFLSMEPPRRRILTAHFHQGGSVTYTEGLSS